MTQTLKDQIFGEIELDELKMDISPDMLDSTEYIPVTFPGEIKDREESYVDNGEDQEPEETFIWLEKLRNEPPELLNNQTYFAVINNSREIMKNG